MVILVVFNFTKQLNYFFLFPSDVIEVEFDFRSGSFEHSNRVIPEKLEAFTEQSRVVVPEVRENLININLHDT